MQRFIVLALGLVLGLGPVALGDPAGYVDVRQSPIVAPVWETPAPHASLPASFAQSDYRSYVPLMCRVEGGTLLQCRSLEADVPQDFLNAAIVSASAARL